VTLGLKTARIPPVDGEVTTRGRVGYRAQDAHLLATTVAENVRIWNKDATDAEVVTAFAEAGLPLDPVPRPREGDGPGRRHLGWTAERPVLVMTHDPLLNERCGALFRL
jgi:hypothetical protein